MSFSILFSLFILLRRETETILDEFLTANQDQANPVPKLHSPFLKNMIFYLPWEKYVRSEKGRMKQLQLLSNMPVQQLAG